MALNLTIEHLFRDLAEVVAGESGCRVTLHTGNPDGKTLDYELLATLELHAAKAIKVEKLALDHAVAPAAYIAALIDEHFRPFAEQLRPAAAAAGTAWADVIDGPKTLHESDNRRRTLTDAKVRLQAALASFPQPVLGGVIPDHPVALELHAAAADLLEILDG